MSAFVRGSPCEGTRDLPKTCRTYRAWCAACSTEWTGTEIDDADVPAGEQRAFFTCRDCGHVGRVSVRLTAKELARYRRAVRRTVSRMVESFVRARARLEERCRSLRQGMREGDDLARESLRAAEERLARIAGPDVGHLERRLSAAEQAEQLVRVNFRSNYAAELLMLASRAYKADRKDDQAQAALRRIVKSYPESPLAADARKQLGLK